MEKQKFSLSGNSEKNCRGKMWENSNFKEKTTFTKLQINRMWGFFDCENHEFK